MAMPLIQQVAETLTRSYLFLFIRVGRCAPNQRRLCVCEQQSRGAPKQIGLRRVIARRRSPVLVEQCRKRLCKGTSPIVAFIGKDSPLQRLLCFPSVRLSPERHVSHRCAPPICQPLPCRDCGLVPIGATTVLPLMAMSSSCDSQLNPRN